MWAPMTVVVVVLVHDVNAEKLKPLQAFYRGNKTGATATVTPHRKSLPFPSNSLCLEDFTTPLGTRRTSSKEIVLWFGTKCSQRRLTVLLEAGYVIFSSDTDLSVTPMSSPRRK